MKTIKTINEVLTIIRESFNSYYLDVEEVDIKDACQRVIANDVISREDVPHFDKSTVDGYALISFDTLGASDDNPITLKIIGEIETGEKPALEIQKGTCARIFTGGEIPEGANSVIMIENCIEKDGLLYVFKPVTANENILKKGEDIKNKSIVIEKGTTVTPASIGVLAALGIEKVKVYKKPKIGIISTGNEIIPINHEIYNAKVRDINSYTLYSSIQKDDCIPIMYGIVKDSKIELEVAIKSVLEKCDIVLISGGSSKGAYDNTLNVLEGIENNCILVDGIAVKPGKPTIIAKINNKAVIGLPGHPASCLFIYNYFVRRLISLITGRKFNENKINAILKTNFSLKSGRTEFVFVKLSYLENVYAEPLYGKSGSITLLSNADGYIRLDATRTGIKEGDIVEVTLF
ncbi:gephyrin-like molybdotransferase Glp [Caldicellulosiruptoraceae bacterium PP1]